jgi:hypothetical protein
MRRSLTSIGGNGVATVYQASPQKVMFKRSHMLVSGCVAALLSCDIGRFATASCCKLTNNAQTSSPSKSFVQLRSRMGSPRSVGSATLSTAVHNMCLYIFNHVHTFTYRLCGAMVAHPTPDRAVACSSHVEVTCFSFRVHSLGTHW